MNLELEGKRAVVTGSSAGIGRAVASVLAEEGCDIVLISRDAENLARAASEIRTSSGASVEIVPADLSKQSEIERIAYQIKDIDILVNNAGAIPRGDLQAIDNDAWRKAWDLKVFGYISLCRALYSELVRRKGVVINIIGAAAESPMPAYIAGSVGNAALAAFTKALGKGAPKDGVRAIAIHPGPVATDRLHNGLRATALRQFGDETRWQELAAAMPYGRPASPEEIANAVAFLASPRSAYTNAAALTIDGGGGYSL